MKQFLKSLLIAFCTLVAFAPTYADDACKNLFNKSDFLSLPGLFVNMYGNLINGGGNTTIIFPVQPNTTYTFSWDGYGGGRIAQFEDLPSSGGTAGTNVGNFYNGGTVTTANATNYIAIHFQKTDSALQPFIDSLQLEQGSTATAYQPYNPLCATCDGTVIVENGESRCIPPIKIATTAYSDTQFAPVETALAGAVATIREIVTKTINQTAAVADLQANKQTRPEEQCPAGKKCLLVETEENGVIVPHWYPIIEDVD